MNQIEKDFYKRMALFIGLKLLVYIFIARSARAARKAAGK